MPSVAFDKIKKCIEANSSFVLEAGAGSGKTYTLIETVHFLLKSQGAELSKKGKKIGCITYTNAAKDEMIERLDYNDSVEINTIHEFLWGLVCNYQVNLKKELIEYHAECIEADKRIADFEEVLSQVDVSYGKYGRRLDKGEIGHDDVIALSLRLFRKYPKLISILVAKYPYFLIDEYQDTFTPVVELFLHIQERNKDRFVLGFFGDSMQKIYHDNRIGKISAHSLVQIEKTENFRSAKKIVGLVNKVRGMKDPLVQIPQRDGEGEVSFYYGNSVSAIDKYRLTKERLGWDFEGKPDANKILVLTNKKISDDLGYRNLLDIFEERFDRYGSERLKEKEEAYIDFLLNKIEKLIFHFDEKNYADFFELFGDQDFRIKKLDDRRRLHLLISELKSLRGTATVKEILQYVFDNKILTKTDKIARFEDFLIEIITDPKRKARQDAGQTFQEKLFELPYLEVTNFNNYMEDNTPYSTQHGTKGSEYDNVLIVLDENHRWWLYRGFDKLVAGAKLNADAQKDIEAKERLLNLLYVSVSRAKEKLAILYLSDLDASSLNGWKNIFGVQNLYDLSA